MSVVPALAAAGGRSYGTAALRGVLRSPRMSGSLVTGLVMLGLVVVLALFGPRFVNVRLAAVGAVKPSQAPSAQYLLGTDSQGRDMLTIMVLATPQTLRIGLIAGVVGLALGLALGLLSGFFGGPIDAVIRVLADSLMTVPSLAIMVIIAASVGHMTVELMGLTVAALAWMHPTRSIRAQVLSIRERSYVSVARANGEGELGILFREVMPNLVPYIAASFVGAVSGAILAAVGLEAIGLGPNDVHTLGTTIYWAEKFSAVLRGQWWWWGPPIVAISFIFVGLFMLSSGLDRIANPKLRTRT
ncbi:MAG: ABC transporter permease [Chloroflexota bacterium]